jgi:hypothetical protein
MGKKRKRIKQARMKEQQIYSQLNEQDRKTLDRLRASLIPNAYGFVASVIEHPVSGLWQGWISDGSTLIFISARNDSEQAVSDVEAFLEASTYEEIRLEDIPSLQAKFDEEGDAPYTALPEDITKTLLFYVRILYALKN